jgi:hypothetical protein
VFEDTKAVSSVVVYQVVYRFGFSAGCVQPGKAWSDLACVRNTNRGSELKHASTLIWHAYRFCYYVFISQVQCTVNCANSQACSCAYPMWYMKKEHIIPRVWMGTFVLQARRV